jgi:hypothetical protein
MEAWGVILTVFTMFGMLGMLVLLIARVKADDGTTSNATMQPPGEAASAASEFKDAA